MTNDKTWDNATEKLIERTESGEIRWQTVTEIASASGHGVTSELVGPAFVAEVAEKLIAVYEYRYQYFTDAEEWHWEREIAICFVDNDWQLEWEWPSPRRRRSLLEAIRYQQSGAEQFLERLLA